MEDLDALDKKILHQLDTNSRQSNASVGKKVRASKEVVNYRIQKLEKNGIIRSYVALFNYPRLGYSYVRLFLNLKSITGEEYERMISNMKKIPQLIWLGRGEGLWEFVAVFLIKNLDEMHRIYYDILDSNGELIIDKSLSPVLRMHIGTQTALYPYLASKYVIMESGSSQKLGEKDESILKELSKNPRIPLIELAKKSKITAKTAATRLKKLVKEKYILGFSCRLSYEKVGLDYYHVFFILEKSNRKNIHSVISFLKLLPETFYIDETLGEYDLEAEFLCHSHTELHNLILKIKHQFPRLIRSHAVSLTYEIFKNN